ncbi:MAG: hypothetical protein V3U28_01640 [Candidatus Acidoferrales bacterium]
MSSVPSMVILPPLGSGPERAGPGALGEQAFRRVPGIQRILPPREDARARQSRPGPVDSERSRKRDLREVRQLVIRSGSDDLPQRFPGNFAGTRFASTHFLVQILGQGAGTPAGPLAHHRDGAELGSEAYRRAGAEPAHYSERPALFRIAV